MGTLTHNLTSLPTSLQLMASRHCRGVFFLGCWLGCSVVFGGACRLHTGQACLLPYAFAEEGLLAQGVCAMGCT
jgi:hypothetical protein